ncbi:MAG: carbon-nitrogen hydrolase family protein [Gammaproteobacteria bacterium]|nr:carbon-nitrogen hydrolase family protein [Gammaproteobacteria bacterium]
MVDSPPTLAGASNVSSPAQRERPCVAALQMTSGPDVDANLATAERLLRAAAAAGACVAVLPENFSCMGLRDVDKLAIAEQPGDGPAQERMAALAAELGLWVIAGTMPLRVPGERRVGAAVLVYDADGRCVARYDKIHLFDVDVPGRPESHRESTHIRPGDTVVTVETPAGRVGLAVCYDIRFPELFRRMVAEAAEWFVLPSAFTVPTGRAHWEVLLRARAIENLAAVVAPGQSGVHRNGRETYGHSLIVDHWGAILASLESGEGVVTAALDRNAQRTARAAFPALAHRTLF